MTMQPLQGLQPGASAPDMTGASQMARILQARDARRRVQNRDHKAESMSLLTQAAQAATDFAKEMRETMKSVTPAPFMKAKLDRRQARTKFKQMDQGEHVLLARKLGVNTYVKLARHLGFTGDTIPIGGGE